MEVVIFMKSMIDSHGGGTKRSSTTSAEEASENLVRRIRGYDHIKAKKLSTFAPVPGSETYQKLSKEIMTVATTFSQLIAKDGKGITDIDNSLQEADRNSAKAFAK